MLPTLIAIVLLSTGLWYGLPGILSGSRVSRERGPEQLMHYPVGIPWFRGKVSTAAWVTRTGRIFAGGGLGLSALILTIAWWPAGGIQQGSACKEMTSLDALSDVTGITLEYGKVVDNGHRCEAEVRRQSDKEVVLDIEVDAPQALIGASLESQTRELERRSMDLRALPTLGQGAVLGLQQDHPEQDAVILFSREESTVRIRLPSAPTAKINTWVHYFRQFQTPEA